VAFTGIRDVDPSAETSIRAVVKKIVDRPDVVELIFGGARGCDTLAIRAALETRADRANPKLTVIVPARVKDQPNEAQPWIRKADEIVQLGLPLRGGRGSVAYRKRNQAMVDRADELVAFWDGRKEGGTHMTILIADCKGIPVKVVTVPRQANGSHPTV
jgi:uncharacterized phage-like protein YoqJ